LKKSGFVFLLPPKKCTFDIPAILNRLSFVY
jgi:hypothetical protein